MSERSEEIARSLAELKVRVAGAAVDSNRSPADIQLIVVTKTYPVSDLKILRNLGVSEFGENRESEGRLKSADSALNDDPKPRWHFQGRIQSNKIKSIASWASVIHSLDESRHIPLIEKAVPEGKILEIFIQVNLEKSVVGAHSPNRGGVMAHEIYDLGESVSISTHMRLMGLMAVAPLGEEPDLAFQRLSRIHSDFKGKFPASPYLSAGMSGDFEAAIHHGATHIRVGSSILDSRAAQR